MTKRERISKLESRMTTAEELLAELRGREGGIAVTGDLAEVANSLPGPLHFSMQQEIGSLREELSAVTAERDALQARIDGGVVVYRSSGGEWSIEQYTGCALTARLIDRQPIAQDERKGDRRKGKERVYLSELGPRGKYFDGYRNGRYVYGAADIRKNDRRRTDGTRADREESK